MSCLHKAVNLTQVGEWCFARIIYYYYYYIHSDRDRNAQTHRKRPTHASMHAPTQARTHTHIQTTHKQTDPQKAYTHYHTHTAYELKHTNPPKPTHLYTHPYPPPSSPTFHVVRLRSISHFLSLLFFPFILLRVRVACQLLRHCSISIVGFHVRLSIIHRISGRLILWVLHVSGCGLWHQTAERATQRAGDGTVRWQQEGKSTTQSSHRPYHFWHYSGNLVHTECS